MSTYPRHLARELAAARRAGIRHNGLMIAGVAAAAMSGLCLGMLAPLPTAPIAIELVVTDWAGEEWIAGSGDTCPDAWTHAAIPADWREIECRPVSLADIAAR
jgi:hypothetical protein